ncbi:MAG: hypothetical protein SFW07_03495 [Gammaproteobacteria bacterium]|nr:hypothetical protein [Gammaproteobacteria bacterium]
MIQHNGLMQIILDVFQKLSEAEVAFLFFGSVWIFTLILGFLIMPMVFNFYLIPKIENKIGKKLGFSPVLNLFPYGRYLNRWVEISKYILKLYIDYKKTGKCSLPAGYDRASLKQAGYTIDMVSKEEIFYSFVAQINLRLMIFSLVISTAIACFNNFSGK